MSKFNSRRRLNLMTPRAVCCLILKLFNQPLLDSTLFLLEGATRYLYFTRFILWSNSIGFRFACYLCFIRDSLCFYWSRLNDLAINQFLRTASSFFCRECLAGQLFRCNSSG